MLEHRRVVERKERRRLKRIKKRKALRDGVKFAEPKYIRTAERPEPVIATPPKPPKKAKAGFISRLFRRKA